MRCWRGTWPTCAANWPEYDVRLPDDTVSELFCLATTLLDHHTYPAADIAEVYRQRWSASETTIGKAKSTITDAGPSRGPILRSEKPDLVRKDVWTTQPTRSRFDNNRALLNNEKRLSGCCVGDMSSTQHPSSEPRSTAKLKIMLDRNFYSVELVEAMHRRGAGAHLVIRMKAGIRLPVLTRLGDGDYLSWIRTPDKRILSVRVVEYDVIKPDATTSELFCLLTTLTDHERHSKQDVAGLYSQRWSAAETTIGENTSTITDAGPSRGPILRSESPDLVLQEIWAWLAATQLVRRAAHTAAVAATVAADEILFTTVRREAIRSMSQSQVTATTPAAARIAATDRAHRHILANKVITGRDRHSPRQQKWRPRFPHTATTKPTSPGPLTPRFGLCHNDNP